MDNPKSSDISALHDELDRLVQENESLKKQLAHSSNFKLNLLSKVSSDLRVPINIINGYTQLLGRQIQTENDANKLRQISEAATFLSSAFDNLYQYLHLSNDESTLIQSTFNFQKLINKLNQLYIRQCQEKNLTFRLHQVDVPTFVIGDSKKVIQIVSTILDNAVKFTSQGIIECTVESVHDEDMKSSLIRFIIKDTGIGFDESKKDQIFHSFSKIHNSLDSSNYGLGISLSIAKKLIKTMQGHISVQSEPGVGSQFIIDIPFSLPKEKTDIPTQKMEEQSLYGLHILLAEDDYFNQRIAVETLQTLGAHVKLAKNGTEAVMLAKTTYFDLILMDIHMPIIDGFKATKEIKRAGVTTPVIAFTSDSLEDTYNAVFAAGMIDIINKPFNIDELVDTIQNSLDQVINY